MSMNRRQILKAGGALAAATALPDMASAQATFAPAPGAWRNFQTVTRLEIAKPAGQVQAWIPLPAFSADDWFKPAGSTWTTNAKTAEIKRDAKYEAEMLHVVWSADETAPVVEVTSKFATRDRAVDLSKPGNVPALSAAEQQALHLGHRPHSRRRHRQGDLRQDHRRRHQRPRQGPPHLRMGRRQHLPQRQDARLRRRRRCRHAQERQPDRQMRRPQRALRRPGARRRHPRPRRLRAARGAFASSATRASAPAPRSSPRRSTAAPRSTCPALAGSRSIRPTCARSCSRSRPANLALDDAKVIAARKALFGAWEMNWLAYNVAPRHRAAGVQRCRRSGSSCTRRPRPAASGSTASIPTPSST